MRKTGVALQNSYFFRKGGFVKIIKTFYFLFKVVVLNIFFREASLFVWSAGSVLEDFFGLLCFSLLRFYFRFSYPFILFMLLVGSSGFLTAVLCLGGSVWNGIVLFLVYMRGLLVVFCFCTSLRPDPLFKNPKELADYDEETVFYEYYYSFGTRGYLPVWWAFCVWALVEWSAGFQERWFRVGLVGADGISWGEVDYANLVPGVKFSDEWGEFSV